MAADRTGWLRPVADDALQWIVNHLSVAAVIYYLRTSRWPKIGPDPERAGLMDGVEVAWFLVLAIPILLAALATPNWVKVVGAVVALCRWFEIFFRSLQIVAAAPDRPATSARRLVLHTLLNVLQVWLLFIALYWTAAYVFPGGAAFADQSTGLHSFGHFAYLSWTTLLTLGSNYSVEGPLGEALVMVELGTGLLLIVAALGALFSAFGTEGPKDPP